ncbi:MAG: hypothetical protein WAM30_14375 [Candidatus Dormiibacterota bacterium]
MRGFAIAIVLVVILVGGVLSFRPGGLRRQMRFAARRLRIALIMAGIYMVASALIRIFVSSEVWADAGMIGLGLALAITFLFIAQDPPLEAGR